jgi:hypothetical protein
MKSIFTYLFISREEEEQSTLLRFFFDNLCKRVSTHVEEKFSSSMKDSEQNTLSNQDMPSKLEFSFFCEKNYVQAVAEVFDKHGMSDVQEELFNEILFFALALRTYEKSGMQASKEFFRGGENMFSLFSLYRESEVNPNKKFNMATAKGQVFKNLFSFLVLNEEKEKLYDVANELIRKEHTKSDASKKTDNEFDLNSFGKLFAFYAEILPPKSTLEKFIYRHIDYILRSEKLIKNLNPESKTNAKVTKFLVDLLVAIEYYERDTHQNLPKMVNNAFLRDFEQEKRKLKRKLGLQPPDNQVNQNTEDS